MRHQADPFPSAILGQEDLKGYRATVHSYPLSPVLASALSLSLELSKVPERGLAAFCLAEPAAHEHRHIMVAVRYRAHRESTTGYIRSRAERPFPQLCCAVVLHRTRQRYRESCFIHGELNESKLPLLSIGTNKCMGCRNGDLSSFDILKRMRESRPELFRGRHFRDEIIVVCAGYLRYPLSYRNPEEMMAERGVIVDHSTTRGGCFGTLRC